MATDQKAKFYEVNNPRMEKVMKQLHNIDKSARSYRVDADARQFVMQPLHDWMQADQSAAIRAEPVVAAPVAKRLPSVKELSTQSLIDWALAAAIEIAERRK